MVFLAITPSGLQQPLAASQGKWPVWCGADAIGEEAYALAVKSHKLSRFVYNLQNASPELMRQVIATVQEHHMGETVWVEAMI